MARELYSIYPGYLRWWQHGQQQYSADNHSSCIGPPSPYSTPSFYYVKFEITDAYSGAPISNAKITMTSSSTGTTYTGYTDANGTYTFNNLPADTYYVNVSAANYQPDSFPLTVNSNMTFPLGLSTY